MKLRLVVLLSGSGRTLQNLIDRIDQNNLDAQIVHVIASRSDAYGVERAQKHSIPYTIVPSRQSTVEERSTSVFELCDRENADTVILAGYMSFLHIPDRYQNRVMNIHPSLLPAFGGKGYYGDKVHKAVLEMGAKVTGCTVHFVDNIYDHGPILIQQAIPVEPDDDVNSLAARVFEAECELYPRAIQAMAQNRIEWIDDRPWIKEKAK